MGQTHDLVGVERTVESVRQPRTQQLDLLRVPDLSAREAERGCRQVGAWRSEGGAVRWVHGSQMGGGEKRLGQRAAGPASEST